MKTTSAHSNKQRLATVGTVALGALYPLAAYVAGQSSGLRWIVFGASAVVVLLALAASSPQARWGAALPAFSLLLGAMAWFLDRVEPLLVFPVAVNAALFTVFAASLRGEVPLVERFARLTTGHLSDARIRYCRSVTVAWCVFFACNCAVAAALAVLAPLSWWALYTGVLSYGLIGVMFAIEYAIRSWRFETAARAFGGHLAAALSRRRVR